MPALPPPFKKTCPCTVLPPPYLIFQIPFSEGGDQTLLSPLKKVCVWAGGGEGGAGGGGFQTMS